MSERIKGRGSAINPEGRFIRQGYPQRATHIMSLIQQLHGGRDYDPVYGTRQAGTGPFAQWLARRVARARQRLGFDDEPETALDCLQFVAPRTPSPQGELF